MTYSSSDTRAASPTPPSANLLKSQEKYFGNSRGHLTSCFIRENFSQRFQTLTRRISGEKFKKNSKNPIQNLGSEPIQTVTNPIVKQSSDSDSDSDSSSEAVTLYSVVKNLSDSSSNNHLDSLYSVVVRGLHILKARVLYSVVE